MKAILTYSNGVTRVFQAPASTDGMGNYFVVDRLALRVPHLGVRLFELIRIRVSGGKEVAEYRELASKEVGIRGAHG